MENNKTKWYKGSLKQSCIFEKIDKIEKPLVKLTKRKMRPKSVNLIKNNITTNTTEILRLIWNIYISINWKA
jgi:hypothetical protein